jgi:DNA-binding transcriptional MerR regulator
MCKPGQKQAKNSKVMYLVCMTRTHKTGDLARRFDLHTNTIRSWADTYERFLSPGSRAAKRKFSTEDALVLATVAQLRKDGIPTPQIIEALAAGKRADHLPPLSTPEEEAARQSIALVPFTDLELAQERVTTLETQLARIIAERDAARLAHNTDVGALNEQISSLQHELGVAQGQLRERRSSGFWLAVVAGVAVLSVVLVVAVFILAGAS